MTDPTLVQAPSPISTDKAVKSAGSFTRSSPEWTRALQILMEKAAARDALHETQRHVVLSGDELGKVLASRNRAELLVGAVFSPFDATLLLFTGTFRRLHVPTSWFAAIATTGTDPTRLRVTNAGQILQFGRREASARTLIEIFSNPANSSKPRTRPVQASSLRTTEDAQAPDLGGSFLALSPMGR